jgi:hypothetical protein
MKASAFYRTAAILLVLFALGHTLGFRQIDPRWGVDSLLQSMRTIRFDVQGFSRTCWDFYVGFGLFVTVFLLFAAVVAWQLGGVSAETLSAIVVVKWGLVVCFVAVSILSWKYFFMVPVVFSVLITLCLFIAALLPVNSKRFADGTS